MNKSQLQIVLSRLQTFNDPDPSLEQYATPPDVAASFLHRVDLTIDQPAELIDLGSGTGILTIG
ncbi:MAG: methyltransferase, partial [Candidatus Nanohaloarchaea archaeon]|nr:methyltransferase [Candidatus Nanohaloarchaea archaeon]